MKYTTISVLFLLVFGRITQAQNLPIKTITLFKNERAMVSSEGKVPTINSKYTSNALPNALFATYWIGTKDNSIKSVFTALDTVYVQDTILQMLDYYKSLIGKPSKIVLNQRSLGPLQEYEGKLESITKLAGQDQFQLLFATKNGSWVYFNNYELQRVECFERPNLTFGSHPEVRKKLEVNFNNNKAEQDISLQYLVNHFGWLPIYQLDLLGKDKGRLSLRAEVKNDAMDVNNPVTLQLAVGVPNFMQADKLSDMVSFLGLVEHSRYSLHQDLNPFRGNVMNIQQQSFYGENEEVTPAPNAGPDPNQAEDYYFYKVYPDKMPEGSRYQFAIFETEVATKHFYECEMYAGGPDRYRLNVNQRHGGSPPEPRNKVDHFVEFKNDLNMPFTTGIVNLLSGGNAISQDKLPYAAPGAKCKVRVAETPEIHVTHSEGDIKREENILKFFNLHYDKVTIEGQFCVVNYKNETVTLKVKRKIEGKPTQTEPENWELTQSAATLRVNAEYDIEWEIILKPGEERKWKYQYEVFVNL